LETLPRCSPSGTHVVVCVFIGATAAIPMATSRSVFPIALLVCRSLCVADVSKSRAFAVTRRPLFPLGFDVFGSSVVIDDHARTSRRRRTVTAPFANERSLIDNEGTRFGVPSP
jgi:hypothetical protein